jgi:hypothetical protein
MRYYMSTISTVVYRRERIDENNVQEKELIDEIRGQIKKEGTLVGK